MLNNKSIVILGMHRSGTSALAGVFNLLGISFGSNLLSPVEGVNEKGFWEHADLVDINDRLLEAIGYCWHDVSSLPDNWWNSEIANKFSTEILDVINRDFSDTSLWGIKDPRLCRLFPLWQQVFDKLVCNPCYVLILRHPSEVCQSLHSRDSFSYIKSIYLWIEHVLESEQWTRDK